MDKFLGQEIPEKDRWQFLQDNADAVEKIGYTHRVTPDELAQKDIVLNWVFESLHLQHKCEPHINGMG